jgi:hypothetical protein
MTPEKPHLTPDQQEYFDQQEQAHMHRRMAMEAYGEQMAKMFARINDEDPDPAQEDMIKHAFADMMCPKPIQFPPGVLICPPTPPRMSSPIFVHRFEDKTVVYDWRTYLECFSRIERITVSGRIEFWDFEELRTKLHGEPAAAYWEWVCEQLPELREKEAAPE